MSPPIGLLVAVLVFWGFVVEQVLVGATLGVLLALIIGTRLSLHLSERQLERCVDFTAAAVVVLLGVQLVANGLPSGLLVAMAWSPVVLFPLLVVGSVNATSLRWRHLALALRRSTDPDANRFVSLSPAYLAATLLAASMAGVQGAFWFFFGGMAAIVVVWLFFARPARARGAGPAFLLAATLAIGIGYFVGRGLPIAQTFLQEWVIDSMADADTDTDALQRQTSIGDLGRIKLSDRIAWRVKGSVSSAVPTHLRTGVFTRYSKGTWFVRAENLLPRQNPILDGPNSVRLVGEAKNGVALIPMPQHAGEISGGEITGSRIQRSVLGVARISDAPDRLDLRLKVVPESLSGPPNSEELTLPAAFISVFERLPELSRLKGLDEVHRLYGVTAWFADNFRYTLFLGNAEVGQRDLERFLTMDRAGHCEYFATATVLILRYLGIPARYVTGYSVQEFSRLEKAYLLRDRHAHAWVEAYVDGRWREIDTTPSNWVTEEEDRAPVWRSVIDLFSYAWDRIKEWREAWPGFSPNLLHGLLATLVVGAMVWLWRKRTRHPLVATAQASLSIGVSIDSPATVAYRLLESRFAALGYSRRPEETPVSWLIRVEKEGLAQFSAAEIDAGRRLVGAYYLDRYGRS